jgi:hypothetical protein
MEDSGFTKSNSVTDNVKVNFGQCEGQLRRASSADAEPNLWIGKWR